MFITLCTGVPTLKLYGEFSYTGCPTRYRTRHFFNNSNINEDIATKFEEEYVRCVRNEEEFVCSAPNCCDMEQRSASQPGSVASETHCISKWSKRISILRRSESDLYRVSPKHITVK